MKLPSEIDQEGWQALADQHGINWRTRWEDGLPHHPKAREVYDAMELSDFVFCNDCFCWKCGGDGDNGETLMYSLSAYYELMDKLAAVADAVGREEEYSGKA